MLQSAEDAQKEKRKKDSAEREKRIVTSVGGIQSDIHIDISGETIAGFLLLGSMRFNVQYTKNAETVSLDLFSTINDDIIRCVI
jgi:hypothetical protein